MNVSTNFRQLSSAEAVTVDAECAEAWMDPAIPMRQYEAVVRGELERFALGYPVAPFNAFVHCLEQIPSDFFKEQRRLLDVGAAAGYYREIIQKTGLPIFYTGLDYSPSFKDLAEALYPGIQFTVGDARDLPYEDNAFDIVLSGCCMLHILDYEKVVAETERVSSQYCIFSKTPVRLDGQTIFYEKDAYGVRCLEIHFGDTELLGLFAKYELTEVAHADVLRDVDIVYRTYLMQKKSQGERQWETA